MKRVFAFVFAAVALAIPAAQAHAAGQASPTAAQFSALKKQVAQLQAQVKALQKFVPKTCSARTCYTVRQLSSFANFSYEVQICQQAVIADAFQGTWNVIDQISTATQAGKTYFGAQTPISDAKGCSNIELARSSGVPPTVGVFSSLVSLLAG